MLFSNQYFVNNMFSTDNPLFQYSRSYKFINFVPILKNSILRFLRGREFSIFFWNFHFGCRFVFDLTLPFYFIFIHLRRKYCIRKNFDIPFSMDLHVLRCSKHDSSIFRKCRSLYLNIRGNLWNLIFSRTLMQFAAD